MSEDPDSTRRSFLAKALGACTACGALAPTIAVILSPLDGGIVKLGDGRLDLGPLDSFEDGKARKLAVRAARTDAYVKEPERALGSVLVVRQGELVLVFAAQCPHAGCDVALKEQALACPCHESRFGLDGSVQGGPAPRPLDRLEAVVEKGRILVRFERFQPGTAEKRAL